MGTYRIPRNTKGEGRLFYIFSTKALIYTVVGIIIGVLNAYLLKLIGSIFNAAGVFGTIGNVLTVIFALAGFVIATFKLPQNDRFEITRKAGGTKLDKVIIESIKFKINKKKLYVFDTDELTREEIETELDEEEKNKEKEDEIMEEKMRKLNSDRRGYIK